MNRTMWYDTMHFYTLTLLNDERVYWWSEESFDAIKKKIANEDFVLVSSGHEDYYKKEEINTKVIRSIEDETYNTRQSYKEEADNTERRLQLVRYIRSSKQPKPVQKVIRRVEKQFRQEIENNRWDDNERAIGMHMDCLMYYNEDFLANLARTCKRKALHV